MRGLDGTFGPATSHPSADPFPFGFAFGRYDHMVVSNIRDPTNPTKIGSVSTYRAVGHTVTPIQTKSSGGILPCWVVITGDGKYVFVVNTGAGHPAPISRFRLFASGKLRKLTPATRSRAGEFARTDAALSRDGKFLYVLAPKVGPGNASHIDEYRVTAKGGLRFIASTPAGANIGIGGHRPGRALGRDVTMPTPAAEMVDLDERLASAELGARVKVCGVTEPAEIEVLAGQQVDFAGLWYGVPGGPADLPLETWRSFGDCNRRHGARRRRSSSRS